MDSKRKKQIAASALLALLGLLPSLPDKKPNPDGSNGEPQPDTDPGDEPSGDPSSGPSDDPSGEPSEDPSADPDAPPSPVEDPDGTPDAPGSPTPTPRGPGTPGGTDDGYDRAPDLDEKRDEIIDEEPDPAEDPDPSEGPTIPPWLSEFVTIENVAGATTTAAILAAFKKAGLSTVTRAASGGFVITENGPVGSKLQRGANEYVRAVEGEDYDQNHDMGQVGWTDIKRFTEEHTPFDVGAEWKTLRVVGGSGSYQIRGAGFTQTAAQTESPDGAPEGRVSGEIAGGTDVFEITSKPLNIDVPRGTKVVLDGRVIEEAQPPKDSGSGGSGGSSDGGEEYDPDVGDPGSGSDPGHGMEDPEDVLVPPWFGDDSGGSDSDGSSGSDDADTPSAGGPDTGFEPRY